MSGKRCGVSDSYDIAEYRLLNAKSGSFVKWGKHTLKWNFAAATSVQLQVTGHAFDIWSRHANLNFVFSKRDPNILISMGKLVHCMSGDLVKRNCTNAFDGAGQILGHALFPSSDNYTGVKEIHIDSDEHWDYTESLVLDTSRTSFLQVITHEIGHVLGIPHTHHLRDEAVMYPFHFQKTNLSGYDLSNDDIYAIQSLYGTKPVTVKQAKPTVATRPNVVITMPTAAITTTSTTVAIPTTSTAAATGTDLKTPIADDSPNLCSLNSTPTFLIVKDKMYIIYKKWFWLKKLDVKRVEPPALISDWIHGLPKDFKELDAIYQSPNGTINIFINGIMYRYTQELRLINVLQDSRSSKYFDLQGAVNTNSGRTLIFYGNNFYREINECDYSEIRFSYIGNDFPSLPSIFKHIFRYTNGKLYFFNGGSYFEYNEFENRVVKSGKFELSLFDIECYDQGMLERIKNAVCQLIRQTFKYN